IRRLWRKPARRPSRCVTRPDGRPELSRSIRYFLITAAEKLDQTNTVTERIGKVCNAAPVMGLDLVLQSGAGVERMANRGLEFRDDESEVHGGPVTRIAADLVCCC